MKRYVLLVLAIGFLICTACTSSQVPNTPPPPPKVVTIDAAKVIVGQTLYVPVYSHIYTEDQTRKMELTTTLSIRNTDLENPMVLKSVKYYDSNGKLLRQYLEQPIEIAALASNDVVVERTDTAGGSGANFIVEWAAEQKITQPVIEAVMINTIGNQGISFISPGRIIKSTGELKQ